MRDLTRERRVPVNGSEAEVVDRALDPSGAVEGGRVPIDVRPVTEPEVDDTALLIAKRDRMLSRIAVVFLDAAKMLDPITRIVMARVLAFGALAAAAGLTGYTLRIGPSWERVVTLSAFLALTAWLVRKGLQ